VSEQSFYRWKEQFAGLKRVILIGHSIAGAEMTMFATIHPARVEKLVYLDAANDFPRVHELELEAHFKLTADDTLAAILRGASVLHPTYAQVSAHTVVHPRHRSQVVAPATLRTVVRRIERHPVLDGAERREMKICRQRAVAGARLVLGGGEIPSEQRTDAESSTASTNMKIETLAHRPMRS
jgi:pimeloyl-ACP methyl ester carboxylesterase